MIFLDLAMSNISQINLTVLSNKCIALHGTRDGRATRLPFTIIYAILIPLIIGANIMTIIGIIKTKGNKFTVSQILFIVLFISDLSFGAIQLPLKIYLIWNVTDPTCLVTQTIAFCLIFPICMSGATLCVISIDRYFYVTQARYYNEKTLTSKTLTLTIFLLIAISFTFSLLHAIYTSKGDLAQLVRFYIALSIYEGTFLILSVLFNIALLRNIKLRTSISFLPQATLHTNILTKTIALIVAAMVVTYIPLITTLIITAYITSTDPSKVVKISLELQWSLIPSYFNAILNSVIYISKNSSIKNFYKRLIKCQKV